MKFALIYVRVSRRYRSGGWRLGGQRGDGLRVHELGRRIDSWVVRSVDVSHFPNCVASDGRHS